MRPLTVVFFAAFLAFSSVTAAPLFFNSSSAANNAATRADWLVAISVTPQYLVDFESGFVNLQNIDDIPGLFPGGLVIRDSGPANQAIIRSGSGIINSSNPVGVFALTHNETAYLELDFTARPVDYVAFQDIDHTGTTFIVTFTDGTAVTGSFETTTGSDDSAEFFGIFRNDYPRIKLLQLDARGDGRWGVDNIEYGAPVVMADVPEPGSLGLALAGLALVIAGASRRGRSD